MINLKRGDNMTSIFSLNKDLLNRYKTIINNIKSPSPTRIIVSVRIGYSYTSKILDIFYLDSSKQE